MNPRATCTDVIWNSCRLVTTTDINFRNNTSDSVVKVTVLLESFVNVMALAINTC